MFNYSKKRKMKQTSNIESNIYINNIDEYINYLYNEIDIINKLVIKKKNENISDDNLCIKNTQDKINKIKIQIEKNIIYLNNYYQKLLSLNKKFNNLNETLCNHELYSEYYYHNERTYYCKKCSFTK